jgi:hypothetical protein
MDWPKPKAYFKPSQNYEKSSDGLLTSEPDFKILHLYFESDSGRFLEMPLVLSLDQEQKIKKFYEDYTKR